MNRPVPPYARLFFDHLYSEYIALRPTINDTYIVGLPDEIHERRRKHDLTWSDIYTFDLASRLGGRDRVDLGPVPRIDHDLHPVTDHVVIL